MILVSIFSKLRWGSKKNTSNWGAASWIHFGCLKKHEDLCTPWCVVFLAFNSISLVLSFCAFFFLSFFLSFLSFSLSLSLSLCSSLQLSAAVLFEHHHALKGLFDRASKRAQYQIISDPKAQIISNIIKLWQKKKNNHAMSRFKMFKWTFCRTSRFCRFIHAQRRGSKTA